MDNFNQSYYDSLNPQIDKGTSSADALLQACEKLVWDGTDLQYFGFDYIAQLLQGVNDNLANACLKADEVFEKFNIEIMNIIENIKVNIKNFAESTKVNEQLSANVLNQVNQQSDAILSELGLDNNN